MTPTPYSPTAQDLKALSDAAEPGPWEYRPREFDDWGMIRGSRDVCPDQDAGPPVASAKPRWDDFDFSAHRKAGTDPMEANGRFIVELVNAYRRGDLIPAVKECEGQG